MIGPHAHEESIEPEGFGPWGWPCPYCDAENVVRERVADTVPRELRCDHCGAVCEFTFGE